MWHWGSADLPFLDPRKTPRRWSAARRRTWRGSEQFQWNGRWRSLKYSGNMGTLGIWWNLVKSVEIWWNLVKSVEIWWNLVKSGETQSTQRCTMMGPHHVCQWDPCSSQLCELPWATPPGLMWLWVCRTCYFSGSLMDVDDVSVVSMMFCDTTGRLAYPTSAHPG